MIGDRWGIADDEVAQPFPCDTWIARPTLAAWRAVTVHAPAVDVWRWVTQVRLAEPFTCVAGKRVGRILSVDPPNQLTGAIAGAVISYVLTERPNDQTTRLLMKIISGLPRPLVPLLSVGDLVMARRQLLNWKHLAERNRLAA